MKTTFFSSVLYKIFAALMIVVLAVTALPMKPAYAAVTAEIVPTANGIYTAWAGGFTTIDEGTAAASCTTVAAVVDYIATTIVNGRESFVIPLTSIPDGSTITSIDVLIRDRGDTAEFGTYASFVRFNGTDSANSATHTVTGIAGGCTGSRTDTFDVTDTVKGVGTTLEIGVIKLDNIRLRVGVLSAVITYNTAPTGGNGAVTTNEDTLYTFTVADFTTLTTPAYSDPEGDPFSGIQVTSLETAGTLQCGGVDVPLNGTCANVTTLTFLPAPNANGSPYATFGFKVYDGSFYSTSSYTMTVNVTAVDDVPVAVGDSATVTEDDPATTINVLANDADVDGGPMTINSVTQPANGTVVITNAGADLTYQPNANTCNNGTPTDDFTYTLNGGSTATVAVTVTCANDPPVAVGDSATVTEDNPATTIDVLANDTDTDGGPMTVASATQPANGAVFNNITDLSYQPNADYCNDGTPTDNFTYTLNGGSSATVAVTVTCVNDMPSFTASNPPAVAANSGAQTVNSWATFNPGPNESGQSVLQYIISNSTCGTLLSAGPSVNTAGDLTYTPATNQTGTCTFDAQVQDDGGTANGGVDTSTPALSFTISVNVSAITLSPVTLPNGTVTFAYSQTITASGGTAPYTFAVTAGTLPTGLTLSSGGVLSGTPTATGTFNFTVTATDSSGGSGPFTGSQAYSITINSSLGYPSVVSTSLTTSYTGTGPGSFVATFNKAVDDPAGNTGTDDVTNPANYLLVNKGTNGVANTATCAGGVVADDTQVAVTSVVYNNATFQSTVTLVSSLPVGSYRLFICGTTSIVDLAGNPLNGGTDYIFDFVVQAVQAAPRAVSAGLPTTGFPQNEITALPLQPADKAYAPTDLWLEIPRLGVKMSIVGVPQTNSGWDVTWLNKDAGWLNGSAFPTWKGNSVITGHVWDALNKPGPFAQLKGLKYGDQIRIHAFGQVYIFELTENNLILPSSTTTVFKHADKPVITLVTCEDYKEASQTYSYRRMVRAVLVSVVNDK
ncbi:MAG TPA: sortase [Anaerolineales bacterium]|nr:sortase [Anaerolineales bacterium]